MASAKHPPIGTRLRALRLQLRWSQNGLAEYSGLRRIEISALESGRNLGTSWRVRTLLAKGFGLKKAELDAYLEGAGSPGEMAAKVKPRGSERAAHTSLAAAVPLGKAPAGFFSKFPNLRDAVRVVAKDSGIEADTVKEAAYRIAAGAAADKKIMEWATLVKEELDRLSGTRINPLKVPNLAAAIRMLTSENPLGEARIKESAAQLVAERADVLTPATIEWVRLLDRALSAQEVESVPAKRANPSKRGPPKR